MWALTRTINFHRSYLHTELHDLIHSNKKNICASLQLESDQHFHKNGRSLPRAVWLTRNKALLLLDEILKADYCPQVWVISRGIN
jgi:hypothetical protein